MGQLLSSHSQPPAHDTVSSLAAPLLLENDTNLHGIIDEGTISSENASNWNSRDEELSSMAAMNDEDNVQALPNEEPASNFMNRSMFPCNTLSVGEAQVFSFVKFSLVTLCLLLVIHVLVRHLDWEHDALNTLQAIVLYQSNLIWLDLVVFFVVCRCPLDLDSPCWLLVTATSSFFSSWITRFPFLQHSATLFEIHCSWSWMTWVYALAVLLICISLVIHHVRYASQNKRLFFKLAEVTLTACAMFGPSLLLAPSDFHLHHWLVGWWLGMHCNFPTIYSKLAMAWCWGMYVNGIAVYGRDPVQMCGYIDYYYQDQHCHADSKLHGDIPSDWRNCSSSGYHP